MTLKSAREQRDQARLTIKQGIDPRLTRKTQRQQAVADAELTSKSVAQDWHQKQAAKWVPEHAATNLSLLTRDIFPHIGNIPVGDIKPELLKVLRRIEERGAISTAKRALQICRAVFVFAGISPNPAADMSKRLAVAVGTNFDAVTDPAQLGEVLRALDDASNVTPPFHATLRLLPLLFGRSTELRMMRWADVDLDQAEWR